jgi:hypothetical protein
LLSVSALGQLEVAPDHFDSSSKKETVRHTAKNRVMNPSAANVQAAGPWQQQNVAPCSAQQTKHRNSPEIDISKADSFKNDRSFSTQVAGRLNSNETFRPSGSQPFRIGEVE